MVFSAEFYWIFLSSFTSVIGRISPVFMAEFCRLFCRVLPGLFFNFTGFFFVKFYFNDFYIFTVLFFDRRRDWFSHVLILFPI